VAGATVDYWVQARRLHVVHGGVYAVGHRVLRVEGRRLAAVLACGESAVLSHRGGAAHWGLLQDGSSRVDVTGPRSRDVAPDHGHCEPDFLWPSRRLVVETDGWETHGTREAFEADRAKDAALTAAGYRVLRFTWRTEPETALRRVRALLA
jgi:hypothetical protein